MMCRGIIGLVSKFLDECSFARPLWCHEAGPNPADNFSNPRREIALRAFIKSKINAEISPVRINS